jgi:hypothetical protein
MRKNGNSLRDEIECRCRRVAEMRARWAKIKDPEIARFVLEMIEEYEKLIEWAERRLGQ